MAINELRMVLVCVALAAASIPKQEKIIPAVLGSSVSLSCSIPQTTQLMWDSIVHYNQTIIALGGAIKLQNRQNQTKFFIQISGNNQTLVIQSLTLKDDGTYRCADLQNVNYKESFKVNILVRPKRIDLLPLPITGIDEGSIYTLTCEADGGKPPPIFEWYIEGPRKNRTKISSAESDTFYPNGTGLRKSQAPLKVDRTIYQSKISCLTEITYFFVVQNNMSLDVNLFPGVPTLRNFDGIFNDGEMKTVTCESRGSRPAANITWYIDNVPQPNANTRVYRDQDDTFYVSSSLTRTFDRSMDGKNLTCRAMNVVLQRQNRAPVETTVVLRIAYMPIINAMNGSLDVYEHNPVILRCHIAALPMPTISEVFWLKNGVIVTQNLRLLSNFSKIDGKLDLLIRDVNRFDMGQYQCQASNPRGLARSTPPLALNVLYRPVCLISSIEKVAASVGQTVTLTCRVTANPTNVTVTWRYKTRHSIIKENQPSFTDPGIDKTATSSIRIKIQIDIDYTDLECIATNSIGAMIQPCLYMIVKPGPPEIPTGCNITLIEPSELDIRCTPGFSGGGQQYFILQRIDGFSFVTINTNDFEPIFNVSNLGPGQNYTYRVCSASDTYRGTISCGFALSIKTKDDAGATDQEPIAAASPQDTTLYIVGGSLGFVFLVLLTVVVVVCIVKRRQQISSRARLNKSMDDVVIRSRNKTEIFEKDKSKSEEHIENVYVDVTDAHGDHHRYHLSPDSESKQDHNILPSKLEEEDPHHRHHPHPHGTPPKDTQHHEVISFEMTGPATLLTLNTVASSRNTFVKGGEEYGNSSMIRNDVIEDIYAISTKHRDYKHENFGESVNMSPLTASRLTLSSANGRDGLCYSESDIQRALDMSTDDKTLSGVTKTLRRSTSLIKLEYNISEIDLSSFSVPRSPIRTDDSKLKIYETKYENHDKRCNEEVPKTEKDVTVPSSNGDLNKNNDSSRSKSDDTSHSSNEDDDDAFVVIEDDSGEGHAVGNFSDKIFVDTQKATYSVDHNEDDEAKLRRRRSYHRAIRTNSISSRNIKNKLNSRDKELDSIDTSCRDDSIDKYSNYDKPRSLLMHDNIADDKSRCTSDDLGKIKPRPVDNNLNSRNDIKTLQGKDVHGSKADLSQNIEAYF